MHGIREMPTPYFSIITNQVTAINRILTCQPCRLKTICRRYGAREQLVSRWPPPPVPGSYTWAVEHGGHCIGSAGLRVDPDQHCAAYTVGLFAAGLHGRGLGRAITGLVLSWGTVALCRPWQLGA